MNPRTTFTQNRIINAYCIGGSCLKYNEASLADVEIKAENGWKIGQNAITAEFSGHSHLKPAEGSATLFVEMGTPLPPDGPSGINKAATTSVTLTPVTGSNDKGDIQYGYTTGTMASPTNWQSSLASLFSTFTVPSSFLELSIPT